MSVWGGVRKTTAEGCPAGKLSFITCQDEFCMDAAAKKNLWNMFFHLLIGRGWTNKSTTLLFKRKYAGIVAPQNKMRRIYLLCFLINTTDWLIHLPGAEISASHFYLILKPLSVSKASFSHFFQLFNNRGRCYEQNLQLRRLIILITDPQTYSSENSRDSVLLI